MNEATRLRFATSKDAVITLSASATKYTTSADIRLSVMEKNNSSLPVYLPQGDIWFSVKLNVKNSKGEVITPTLPQAVKAGPLSRFQPILGPHRATLLGDVTGTSFSLATWGYANLGLGVYKIQASVGMNDLKSNIITISVTS